MAVIDSPSFLAAGLCTGGGPCILQRLRLGSDSVPNAGDDLTMNKKIALLTMSMIVSAGFARAADVDPILLRQTIMDLQGGTLAGIVAVANAKGDIKKLEGAAKGLQ